MNLITAAEPSDPVLQQQSAVVSRLERLERSNARWRAAMLALVAALGGLAVGGMGGQPGATGVTGGYEYVATDNTIYRIDGVGRIDYIRLEDGVKSAEGYFGWGPVRIDPARSYSPKP